MNRWSDSIVAADIVCPGRLDAALREVVAPLRDDLETLSADREIALWFLRDTRRGGTLQVRLQGAPEFLPGLREAVADRAERFVAESSSAPDDAGVENQPDVSRTGWTWALDEPPASVFGIGPLQDDDAYRRYRIEGLSRGSELALSWVLSPAAGAPRRPSAQSLFAHTVATAKPIVDRSSCGWGGYLRYHRDTLMRSLVQRHPQARAKVAELIDRFDQQADSSSDVVDQLRQLVSEPATGVRASESRQLGEWLLTLEVLVAYLESDGAPLITNPEPFAEQGLFSPVLGWLHTLANQLGVDKLNEALTLHLVLRATGHPPGDTVALTLPLEPTEDAAEGSEPYPVIARIGGVPATTVDGLGTAKVGNLVTERSRLAAELDAARSALVDYLFEQIPRIDPELRTFALQLKRDAYNGRPLAKHRGKDLWPRVVAFSETEVERVVTLEARIATIEHEGTTLYREQLLAERRFVLRWIDDPKLRRGMGMASPKIIRHLERLRRKPPERWGRKERSIESTVVRYLTRAALQLSPFSVLTRVGLATVRPSVDGRPVRLLDQPWRERSLLQVRRAILDRFTTVLVRVPVVRSKLLVGLNETIAEVEPNCFRYIRPGRWEIDTEAGEMSQVLPATVNVTLSGALIQWLIEHTKAVEQPYCELSANVQSAFGAEVTSETLRSTLEKLIDIGFLRLFEPWGSDALHLEPRILHHLEALRSTAEGGESLDSAIEHLRELLDLERGFADAAEPVEVVLRCQARLEAFWATITSLAGIDPAVEWQPKAKTAVCEDVFVEAELTSESPTVDEFPESIAELDRDQMQCLLDDAAPLVRLSNCFDRQHDLLSTLGAFAAERWPGRRDVDFFTFFEAAQPLWREHSKFEAELRREGLDKAPGAFNPLGLESVERIRRVRQEIWDGLPSCKVTKNGRTSLDGDALRALLDRAPEPWSALRDATLFLQPADQTGECWVLNTLFEELRYGCRYTAMLSPDLCKRFTGFFEARSTEICDGERVELIDVLCPGGRGVNVHALQTPRVLVVPGERTDADPARQVTLDQLRVELPDAGPWPRLLDEAGRQLAPIYLGTTVLRFMPLMLKFLALFGPGTLNPIIPELKPRKEGDIAIQDRLYSGRVLLKRQRWLISPEALRKELFGLPDDELFLKIQSWRLERGIPRRVFIARRSGLDVTETHYKPQYVDFGSPLSVALFRATVFPLDRERIGLEEVIPAPDAGLARARDADARWAFEIQLDSFPARRAGDRFWDRGRG